MTVDKPETASTENVEASIKRAQEAAQTTQEEIVEASIKRAQEAAQTTQEQILEGVAASQQWILESVRTQAKAVKPLQDQNPGSAAADIHKKVDEAFDFSAQLLASQREFTHKLVAASTPSAAK